MNGRMSIPLFAVGYSATAGGMGGGNWGPIVKTIEAIVLAPKGCC